MTTFARARSDAQRAQRAAAILGAADAMLREMPVAEVTLNELARRVGLAKSNVLRYFPSRESVLLQLLDRETRAWLDAIESRAPVGDSAVAAAIAACAVERPVLCDLIANAAAVLERNVSSEVAAEYKLASLTTSARLARLAGFPGLETAESLLFVGTTTLAIGGLWHMSQPTEPMREAYAAHPELLPFRIDFEQGVREIVHTTLAGIRARAAAAPADR